MASYTDWADEAHRKDYLNPSIRWSKSVKTGLGYKYYNKYGTSLLVRQNILSQVFMENKHNPNFLRADASSYWSDLPVDLLTSVLERLSFVNFQRATSVCSSWYSASREVVSKNHQILWLILFPEEDDNNNSYCTLFSPEEKHKLYKTQDLGVEFAKSVCIATYGSWLLMRDPRYNLYILNLFTDEKIDLPSVESQLGTTKIERGLDDWFLVSNDQFERKVKFLSMGSPVIWIDEKTKEDYIVLWGLGSWCVFYAKKGDTSWNQVPGLSHCLHMVYKDHKLYFSSTINSFTILDFSGDIPQQTMYRQATHSSLPKPMYFLFGFFLKFDLVPPINVPAGYTF